MNGSDEKIEKRCFNGSEVTYRFSDEINQNVEHDVLCVLVQSFESRMKDKFNIGKTGIFD